MMSLPISAFKKIFWEFSGELNFKCTAVILEMGHGGSSLPTELEGILGHGLGRRIHACCDFHWLSMKHFRTAFLHVPASPRRNAAMMYGFDLVYVPDECCSISRHIAGIEALEWVQLCLGHRV